MFDQIVLIFIIFILIKEFIIFLFYLNLNFKFNKYILNKFLY